MKTIKKRKQNHFIVEGGLLVATSMIIQLLGIIKRIPLTNIIGDEGNGYYAAAFELYALVFIVSSFCLPAVVSKLVSARARKGQFKNAQKVFRVVMLFATTISAVACIFLYLYADKIATNVMSEPMSAMALKMFAPALFIVAIMGVLQGYFQGIGTIMPTVISQITEQIIVIIVSIVASLLLFHYGNKVGSLLHDSSYGPGFGALGGAVGVLAGGVAGLLFLLFVFSVFKRKFNKQIEKDVTKTEESYEQIIRSVLIAVFPLILSALFFHISAVIDQSVFNKVMIANGLSDSKSIQWGVFSGKYKILIYIPVIITSAVCASLVPFITNSMYQGEVRQVREKIQQVIRKAMWIAIPFGVSLAVLGKPVVDMLFNGEIDLAANMLHVGTISIIFFSLAIILNGVLQGMNRIFTSIVNGAIALFIHVAALLFMLKMLDLGIYAVVYSDMIFGFILFFLNSFSIRKNLKYQQEWLRTFVIPFICSGIMGGISFGLYQVLVGSVGNILATLLALAIGALVYFILLIALKGIHERELMEMPGGPGIVQIAKIIHIL